MNRYLIICILLCSAIANPAVAMGKTAIIAPTATTTAPATATASPAAAPTTPATPAPAAAADCRIVCPLAIKTNLLFDLVGAPNVGIEIPLGRRFSVSADFAYAHWRIKNTFAMQTLQGSVELKLWLNPRDRPLTGWSIGAYGTYSDRFDIQCNGGWQGDGFVSTGLIAGYSFRVSRSLNLEFALGAGAFYTPEARKYSKPQDGHLIWEETRQNVWRIAPTKLKLNLIWLIQSKKRTAR